MTAVRGVFKIERASGVLTLLASAAGASRLAGAGLPGTAIEHCGRDRDQSATFDPAREISTRPDHIPGRRLAARRVRFWCRGSKDTLPRKYGARNHWRGMGNADPPWRDFWTGIHHRNMPWSVVRSVGSTSLSMSTPLRLKRWRRPTLQAKYVSYRGTAGDGDWANMAQMDVQQPGGASSHDDVEDDDWRFVIPLTSSSWILWRSAESPMSLAITAPHAILIVFFRGADREVALPATTSVGFKFSNLPLHDRCFDVIVAPGLAIVARRDAK